MNLNLVDPSFRFPIRRSLSSESHGLPAEVKRRHAADAARNDRQGHPGAPEGTERLRTVRRGRTHRQGAPSNVRQNGAGRDGGILESRGERREFDERSGHADRGDFGPRAHHVDGRLSQTRREHSRFVAKTGRRQNAVHNAELRERPESTVPESQPVVSPNKRDRRRFR